MFKLDINTISITTTLISFIFFIGLYNFSKLNKRFKGFKIFSLSCLSLFTAFLLISLRAFIPQLVSVIVADCFIALAFYLFLQGSFRFFKRLKTYLAINIILLILFISCSVYLMYFQEIASYKDAPLIIYTLIMSLIISIFFLTEPTIDLKKQKRFIAYGFILYSTFCLFAIICIFNESCITDPAKANVVHSLFFLLIQLLMVNSVFLFIWIANSRLNNDLETQANIDHLTLVLNRRAFSEELLRELARSRRQGLVFSLIMADIDRFKRINESFGHLAGDSVLISLSQLIIKNLRINDVLARFEGEKFVMILPNTSKKYAGETAERIRSIIEMDNHPFNGKQIGYTVSLGVTSFDIDAQNSEELLDKVESALSQAKGQGRNKVVVL